MNAVIQVVGLSLLVPAAVSFAILTLLRRWPKAETWQRYAAAVAFAVAYCTGYALLPSWAELIPERHWHWTFHLALVAAAIGPIALAGGLLLAERWVLWAATALLAAWLLVPHWANLEPSRLLCVPLLAGYLFLLAALSDPLPSRFPSKNLLALLTLAAACLSVLIAAFVSLTYARPAGVAAAALAGCWGAAWFSSDKIAARGICLAYAVTVGGWAYIACIDPQRPLLGLMLAPLAPLALWCFAWGPLARLRGLTAAVAQTAAVLIVLAAAAALAVG